MDGWKVADLTISALDLVAVSVLTIGHRFRNDRRTPKHIYALFGIRLGLSVVILVFLATSGKIKYPIWVFNAQLSLLQLCTSFTEWIVLIRLVRSLIPRVASILKWKYWPLLALLKALNAAMWLRPWIRSTVCADHIIDDVVFLVASLWLRRRGAKMVFTVMGGFYFLGLLVAISSLILTSIRCSAYNLTNNTLLYAHLLIQTLCLSGTLFDMVNKHERTRRPRTQESTETKGNNPLISSKASKESIRSGSRSLSPSFHPPLPFSFPWNHPSVDDSRFCGSVIIIQKIDTIAEQEIQLEKVEREERKSGGENGVEEMECASAGCIEIIEDYQSSFDGDLRGTLKQEAAARLEAGTVAN